MDDNVDISESISPEIWNDIDIFKDQIEMDDPLWKEYVDKAGSFDERMVDEWNKIVDVILVYVALIISVLTSFVIVTSALFTRNPADISNDLLVAIYNQMIAQSNNTSIPVVDVASLFNQDPTDYNSAVIYNALLYTSLALCIVVSVVALAAKLWLVTYSHRAFSTGTLYERAMKRQEAYNGLLAWKMGAVINILPLILLVALVMFGFFIHQSVWSTQRAIGFTAGTIITLGLVALAIASLAAAFIPSCPFYTSLSTLIQLVFKMPEKILWRILTILWGKPSQKTFRCLRIGGFTIMWFVWSVGIACAILFYSGAFTSLVCVPVAITFAYSMQERPGAGHKPQKYKFPSLLVLSFLVIAPPLAAAGYFSNRQKYPIFITLTLYTFAMLALYFFGGWMSSRLSKSMAETAEVDAIAWLLRATPSQDPTFFKKAGQIVSTSRGRHYKSRLLGSLMPLLSPLITSHRIEMLNEESQLEKLEIYVSCLARLSTFTDYEGSFWRMKEDGMQHPPLEAPLGNKLMELATNPRYSPSLKRAATEVLNNYKLNGLESQGRSGLRKRQMSGDTASTIVESSHSFEEMELHSRHKNGSYTRVDV